jgi:hypothetical protein
MVPAIVICVNIARPIVFTLLVTDHLNGDKAPRPDPPGTEEFVFCYFDAHFDGAGSMLTMTDPPPSESPYFDAHFDGAGSMSTMTDSPPSESPLEKHCKSFSFAANPGSWNTYNDNRNTNNDNDSITYFTSNDPPTSDDPPITDNDTLTQYDKLLLSMAFPQHSFMVKYFQEFATRKEFLPMEQYKPCFTIEEFRIFFPGESNNSLDSNPSPIQNKNHARRGYFFLLLQISWPYQVCSMLFSCGIFLGCQQ